MKAFVTSIGEKTTKICCEQLEKYGFNVILLDKQEKWIDKYKRFIDMANEDCLRIDADNIVNKHILEIGEDCPKDFLVAQYGRYDLYRNEVWAGGPLIYTKKALDIIRERKDKINESRPETSSCRFPEINPYLHTSNLVVGLHGFFQDKEAMERAMENKKRRGQMKDYDFELVKKLMEL